MSVLTGLCTSGLVQVGGSAAEKNRKFPRIDPTREMKSKTELLLAALGRERDLTEPRLVLRFEKADLLILGQQNTTTQHPVFELCALWLRERSNLLESTPGQRGLYSTICSFLNPYKGAPGVRSRARMIRKGALGGEVQCPYTSEGQHGYLNSPARRHTRRDPHYIGSW